MNARHPNEVPQLIRTAMPAVRHPAVLVREHLAVGDRVRSLRSARTGIVMKVYPDGSACITWDDKPAPLCLGHERVPRSLFIVLGSTVTESEGGEA
jgi:hypothetical protein